MTCYKEERGDADKYKFVPQCLQTKCYEMQSFHLNWGATLKMSFSKVNTF